MIDLEINGKKHTINTELSITQYQEYMKNLNRYTGSSFSLLSLLAGVEEKELKKVPKNEVDFVLTFLTNEMFEIKSQEIVKTFRHRDVVYGLENRWDKLAWGAWQDFEILSAENITENIHHLMAILYRPVIGENKKGYIIEEYDSDTIMERAEDFKDIPINYWFGVSRFFFLIAELYIQNIKSSLTTKKRIAEIMWKGWRHLPKFVREKVPLDSIINSRLLLRTKTSRK